MTVLIQYIMFPHLHEPELKSTTCSSPLSPHICASAASVATQTQSQIRKVWMSNKKYSHKKIIHVRDRSLVAAVHIYTVRFCASYLTRKKQDSFNKNIEILR